MRVRQTSYSSSAKLNVRRQLKTSLNYSGKIIFNLDSFAKQNHYSNMKAKYISDMKGLRKFLSHLVFLKKCLEKEHKLIEEKTRDMERIKSCFLLTGGNLT